MFTLLLHSLYLFKFNRHIFFYDNIILKLFLSHVNNYNNIVY